MQINKIKTIIVDDEPHSLEVLESLLNHTCKQVEIVGQCTSANEAIEQIQYHQPDLVILDIEMPEKDGFEVLKAFEKAAFKVIIVTGYEQYALKAIKFAAIDYVLKPIEINELTMAVEKVERSLNQKDARLIRLNSILDQDEKSIDKIIIPSLSGFRTIPLMNIVSIKSQSGNYCLFKLIDQKSNVVTKALNYFEEFLPFPMFFRIHRSYMINLDKVVSYESKTGKVVLENGNQMEVAVRRRPEFYKSYKSYIG